VLEIPRRLKIKYFYNVKLNLKSTKHVIHIKINEEFGIYFIILHIYSSVHG